MQRATRWMMFSACLAAGLLAGAVRAEDRQPAAKRQTLDESIYQNLRTVIDHGANLYNQGDWNGCYRLWEGALMSLKPLLDHRPKLQEAIDGGLVSARQDAMLWHRAWVLRPVLDKIRSDIDTDYPHGKKSQEKTPTAETEPKKTEEAKKPVVTPEPKKTENPIKPVVTPEPKPKAKTMWERLGGEAGVTRIVDDFVNLTTKDPKVDFFRHNKVKLDGAQVAKMKREFVEQVSEATGGPLKYHGPDMKKVHKDLGITNEQFDAAAADLKKALEKNKVAPEDRQKILDAVESYRKEIVQPKKPEEKKPVERKPEEKKPVEKKPEEKKRLDQQPEAKKPLEKKPADKNPATTASVTGKLSYKGQAVPNALVTFVGEKGEGGAALIGPDGSYTVNNLKPGSYKVTVDPPLAREGGPKPVSLPAKYSKLETSGLTCTVKNGKQTQDFKLD